jgi:hypothetical protein
VAVDAPPPALHTRSGVSKYCGRRHDRQLGKILEGGDARQKEGETAPRQAAHEADTNITHERWDSQDRPAHGVARGYRDDDDDDDAVEGYEFGDAAPREDDDGGNEPACKGDTRDEGDERDPPGGDAADHVEYGGDGDDDKPHAGDEGNADDAKDSGGTGGTGEDNGGSARGEDGDPPGDPSDSDSSTGGMDISVRIPVPEVAMGYIIGTRCTRLATLEELTRCRKIIAKGVRGGRDRTIVAFVPRMSVAKEITNLVDSMIEAWKRRGDKGVQTVLDEYFPVSKRTLPMIGAARGGRREAPKGDRTQNKGGAWKCTFRELQKEARRKAVA